jgi:predicted transcriptional regulator
MMKQLTKAEEQIMQILWKLEKAFLRDIMEAMPDPKPHNNTVALPGAIARFQKIFLKKEKGALLSSVVINKMLSW